MAKYKLALIGRNISHSKSPEIYKNFLKEDVEYSLLDYSSHSEIPTLEELFFKFDGISITSPYKEHFINFVQMSDEAKKLNAINCISFNNGKFYGHNTDYLAVVDILKNVFIKYHIDKIIILGDGVMSRVCSLALETLKANFIILSRKKNLDFSSLNLVEHLGQDKLLVINTCSRDYVYNGLINENIFFWDLNYNFPPHQNRLLNKCHYEDGYNMLELQALYALEAWSIKKKI